jgi:tetratricopeptide (TPR) repeat protein
MNSVIKILIFTFTFTLSSLKVEAEMDVDSLRSELLNATHDTTRILLLFQIGNQFLEGPSDSLIFYYQKALLRIESFFSLPTDKLKHTDEIIVSAYRRYHFRALNEIGIEKFFLGQYNESIDYAKRALKIAEEIGDIGMISE